MRKPSLRVQGESTIKLGTPKSSFFFKKKKYHCKKNKKMANPATKKKIAVASIASILLVAAVVGTVVGLTWKKGGGGGGGGDGGGVSATTRAVTQLCSPTDFKETCEQSLAGAKSSDPKELIKLAFEVAIKNITDVIKNSELIKKAAKDESTKGALDVCKEVLEDAIDDLKRSADKIGQFDINKVDSYVEDVITWLSATVTYQETCIDAFENTTGDTGEKMKTLLKTARELSINGLAIVEEFKNILPSLQLGSSRRLLSEDEIETMNVEYDPTDYPPGTPPGWQAGKRNLLAATPASLKHFAVVAQDGSAPFKTISAAVATLPKNNPTNETRVIYIKAGVYKENVVIPKIHHVMLIGDGPLKTRISGRLNFADGTKTFHTATLAVSGEDFTMKDIGVENTAGPEKHQAVALRVSGDKAVIYNCHIDGYQDTLYAHNYRHFYRDCLISGTVDFVFGDALAVFQNCRFIVRKPGAGQKCMVTAQGREHRRVNSAIIIHNGTIEAEPAFVNTKPALEAYLGRPWKEFSRTIIMQSRIDGFIHPDGWAPWQGTMYLNSLYYGEYQNRGDGSNMAKRVKWGGIQKITPKIAQSFTPGAMFRGEGSDKWVTITGVPYYPDMMKM
ncbi:hypothetical protein BUALT_Bualt12G0118200 [Buddleja alternifolia]|uniref:Pectinesterase n=1 Tax=Buddleja alternifolia TaxID=168488 RepID=A0AAV6WQH0_9LAMI|nr:hypothetical protein BUALT_Bualt12G0118200 [Buddleja alternifolia]